MGKVSSSVVSDSRVIPYMYTLRLRDFRRGLGRYHSSRNKVSSPLSVDSAVVIIHYLYPRSKSRFTEVPGLGRGETGSLPDLSKSKRENPVES